MATKKNKPDCGNRIKGLEFLIKNDKEIEKSEN